MPTTVNSDNKRSVKHTKAQWRVNRKTTLPNKIRTYDWVIMATCKNDDYRHCMLDSLSFVC